VKNTIRKTKQKMAVLPNGFILNKENIDNDDMKAILSSTRDIPLSGMEKLYIDEMHNALEQSIGYIKLLVVMYENDLKEVSNDFLQELRSFVSDVNGIINVNSDMIGRGYRFEVKEINESD